MDRETAAL